MSDYRIVKLLGAGSFGNVYHARKKGTNYAIKKVENTCPTARQEIEVLKKVEHSCIIKYFGNFWEEGKICIVLEYADKGTFEKVIKSGKVRSEVDAWRVMGQISSALSYLHAFRPKQILHRDLKPDNLLGVNTWSKFERKHLIAFKLADFGVAKLLNKYAQEAYYGAELEDVATYMAPEVWQNYEQYSEKSDIWSLGCLMAFLVSHGNHLFFRQYEVLGFRGDNVIENGHQYSSDLVNFILEMISPNERDRPTAKEVYQETQKNDRTNSAWYNNC